MSTIHLHETTTSTPEQFVAGLTDFGPGRSQLFGRSADGYLEVHDQGPDYADVTEGSGGVWERLHYDWSDPNHVVLTTTDSNLWGGALGHTYTFTSQSNGTTDVDVVVVRDGKNFKGQHSFLARVRRQARAREGARQDRQGDRSPERRSGNRRRPVTHAGARGATLMSTPFSECPNKMVSAANGDEAFASTRLRVGVGAAGTSSTAARRSSAMTRS